MKKAILGLALLSGCVKSAYGGREQQIRIDEATELQLGIQGYQEALASSALSASEAEIEPVLRVGRRLAAAANKPGYRWEFRVIVDDDAQDAWCLPGGKVALTTGLYPALEDETGIAFVMGHEVSHALLRHGAERVSQSLTPEAIGLLAAAPLGGGDPEKQRTLLGCYGAAANAGVLLPFGREHESEADRLGLELMARAGYDPRKAVEAWRRMEQRAGGAGPGFLATHPTHAARLKDLEARMPTALALYDQAVKAPSGRLPKVGGRKGKAAGAAPPAPPGSVVANAASFLRTKTKENRHALLLEFWLNEDVYLEGVRISGPDGLAFPIDARVGVAANAKKQALLVRPETGGADFPEGKYAVSLAGSASGRTFSVSCAFDVR